MEKLKITDVISKFSGNENENIDVWIQRLETAVEIFNNADDIAKMIPLFLTGSAFCTWNQLEKDKKADIKEVKNALRRVYGTTKISAWSELKKMRLQPGEAVDVIADRILSLLKVISGEKPVPEEIISFFLADALPEKVRDRVLLNEGEEMKKSKVISLSKSMLSCEKEEVSVNSFNYLMNSTKSSLIQNNEKQIASNTPSEDIFCSLCKRKGHIKKNCRVKCFSCGQNGHYKNQCSGNERAETMYSKK